MKRILLEGPAFEPVLLAEAKSHLRLDGDAEDTLVAALIAAARVAVEVDIRRVLIAQRWRAVVESWPRDGIVLPVGPLLSVEGVRVIDGAGAVTLLGKADYHSEPTDGSVRLFASVPAAARTEIDFTAGYGMSGPDVPAPLRQAIRMLLTHWYEHRSCVVMGETSTATPHGFRELVTPYRRLALC
jgi:uncharacterized phiE125 gp8 family phage protein